MDKGELTLTGCMKRFWSLVRRGNDRFVYHRWLDFGGGGLSGYLEYGHG